MSGQADSLISELAGELAGKIAQRYRIDADTAIHLILDIWGKNPQLQKVAAEVDATQVKRTAAYKDAANQAKTHIYNHLRRYKQGGNRIGELVEVLRGLTPGVPADDEAALDVRSAIVQSHISTRERLGEIDAFFVQLFALAPQPETILDIGCGVQPLLYPFSEATRTQFYLGLDRDADCINAVQAWGTVIGGGRLQAQRWRLADDFDDVATPATGQFDLAIALKFVPVIARQERASLARLRNVPARRLIVTGASQAMVKRRSIEQREEKSLIAFADEHGFEIVGKLEIESEIGLLLEPRDREPGGIRGRAA